MLPWHNYIIGLVLSVMIMATIPTNTSSPDNIKSKGDHVSNIQTLSRERERLSESISRWNIGYEFAMFVLIVGAIGTFVTQRATISKTERLDSVDRSIFREKDALANLQNQEFEASLHDKELRIQELKAENLRLEAAITPRRLSDHQKQALGSLGVFANRVVEVKSYSTDTEGLLLATEIAVALNKSHIPILDNRLTMMPSGSINFGVSVSGSNAELVKALREILHEYASTQLLVSPQRAEVIMRNDFGRMTSSTPPDATIEVGPKPIK